MKVLVGYLLFNFIGQLVSVVSKSDSCILHEWLALVEIERMVKIISVLEKIP